MEKKGFQNPFKYWQWMQTMMVPEVIVILITFVSKLGISSNLGVDFILYLEMSMWVELRGPAHILIPKQRTGST